MDICHPDPSTASTWVELLRRRAALQPERLAYTFLRDGETDEAYLTYGELDRQARAVGSFLQRQGAVGHRALLLYPSGLEYIIAFFGCLYAGAAAVPVYPPRLTRLDRTLPRLRAIVNDAQPRIALTTSAILSTIESFLAQDSDFGELHWLATDTIDLQQASEWSDIEVCADTLAFLQYTSGSTTTPRGVMVTHGNLLHNESLVQRAFELTTDTIAMSWLPLYHDMGLIGNVLQALYTGFPLVLMSPVDFVQKPIRWLQAVSRTRATASGGPNFAYDLCLRHITPEERATLDLRSWQVAYSGSEPIRAETLERFAATFESSGFRREAFLPAYGLAEATLFVTGGPKSTSFAVHRVDKAALERNRIIPAMDQQANAHALIGCGRTWPGQEVAIVDPQTCTRCQAGQIGEIWLRGPSIAQGYWNQPEATEKTFRAYISPASEGPYLRTGDLGFLQNGELIVTSRLKDLIIIRGRNHAPQDIESTAAKSHPALRPGCGIAFSIDGAGVAAGSGEQLVIVHEVERHARDVDIELVASAVRQAVAQEHELHVTAVVLIKTGTIPKTSSGKLQRRACRAAFLADTLEKIGVSIVEETAVHPEPLTEEDRSIRAWLSAAEPAQQQGILMAYLQRQLARALGAPAARLDPDQSFATLGLDSLKALELKNRIESDLDVEMPLVSFIEQPTLSQLSRVLLGKLADTAIAGEAPIPVEQLLTGSSQLPIHLDRLSDEQVDALIAQLAVEEVAS